MAELLELDAEVMNSHLADLTSWLADLAFRVPARILDLGSGPGTGALALARRFPGATVTAVDLSPRMLRRLEERAAAQGLADRVRVLQADLDDVWPHEARDEPYDLMWAAAFLHHLKDPGHLLARAFAALRPGGLLAVTEMDFFPRFLPEEPGGGDGGLEARLHAVTDTRPPPEWSDHLARAGFAVEARRPFEIHLRGSRTGTSLPRYAHICLSRLRSHGAGALAAEDLAALDALLDETRPNSVARRGDLTVRTTRTTWVARRP